MGKGCLTFIVNKTCQFMSCFQLNVGSVGLYRTEYTSDMLDKFIPAIKDKSLPPRDRLGLQNDIFAMVGTYNNTFI